MNKLLASDFYRLFRSKSFYICTAVAAFIMVLNIMILRWSMNVISTNDPSAQLELYFPYKNGLEYGMSSFTNGNVFMFLAIFISIYITADFTYGTMKNVVSKGYSRIQIYLSKLITMVIASFILIFALFLISTIVGTIVIGSFAALTWSEFGTCLGIIGVELLLYATLASIFIMVSMLIRNIGGAIAINILGISTIAQIIYLVLEYLFKSKIKFTTFSVQYNIQYFSLYREILGTDYLRAIIVGIIFLAVSMILGMFVFKKSDV